MDVYDRTAMMLRYVRWIHTVVRYRPSREQAFGYNLAPQIKYTQYSLLCYLSLRI